ncbi:MAG: DUF4136 domain-containing protein [Candidatus Latescibacteria bacterium]|nr:DUF4136 domain-containing protein [Candidatus Latescibacterota bacterium]
MKRLFVPALMALAVLAACSQKGFEGSVDITPQPVADANFTAYKTWMFGREGQYPPTGLDHIDQPQFRVAAGKHFADEMTKLGYVNSTDNPDLVFLLHIASEQKWDEQKMDDVYKGYDMAWTQVTDEDIWNEGTIIIFAMDGKTGKQVWSSTAQARLQDFVGYEDRLERFNKVITKMLADFPPRVQ